MAIWFREFQLAILNPSPVSPEGERSNHLGTQRKETDKMPSPFGEGQMDTPINCHNQGEVPRTFAIGLCSYEVIRIWWN
jgi:hypothetical protein